MNVRMILNPRDLIEQLCQLQEKSGYIFRGHSDTRYQLIPNAFRSAVLKENSSNFPVSESVISEWFNDESLLAEISCWLRERKITQPLPLIIIRFFRYWIHVMQYNYALYKFIHTYPNSISPEDMIQFNRREVDFWKSEQSFQYLVKNTFPRLIQRFHLDGTILQKSNPVEDLTGVDETFPQHYGVKTAALDWSHNFLVALFFSLGKNLDTIKCCRKKTTKLNDSPLYLSIHAYKELSSNNEKVILLLDKSKHVSNLRAERQQGTFTYFRKPCSFYLQHGEFPYIEYYDNNLNIKEHHFELIKFILERTPKNIYFLDNFLKTNGIDESYLLPSITANSGVKI